MYNAPGPAGCLKIASAFRGLRDLWGIRTHDPSFCNGNTLGKQTQMDVIPVPVNELLLAPFCLPFINFGSDPAHLPWFQRSMFRAEHSLRIHPAHRSNAIRRDYNGSQRNTSIGLLNKQRAIGLLTKELLKELLGSSPKSYRKSYERATERAPRQRVFKMIL